MAKLRSLDYNFRVKRGVALVAVLLMAAVLAIMVLTLILMARERSFSSLRFHERTQALYVAEAGLADALEALEQDNGWTQGFDEEPMDRVRGHYTLQFVEGTPDDWESVNNLLSDLPAHSYKGTDTVPPRSALLVVTGHVGGVSRRLEALVRGGSAPLSRQAMLATGRVRLLGDVSINGVRTLTGTEEALAGIHSNSLAETVTWEGEADETAVITGTVSTRNPATDAIALGTGPNDTRVDVGEVETGAPPVTPPYVDIPAEVESHRGPNLTLSGSQPVLSTGDHFYDGDLEIQGDLVLDGANLYVAGNLEVNGSITGDGSVYTTGDTRFFGDARIESGEGRRVALYSQGHVHLSGFNGTEFLEQQLAGDSQMLERWNDVQEIVDISNELILNYQGSFSPGNDFGKQQDLIQSRLGSDSYGLQYQYLFTGDYPVLAGRGRYSAPTDRTRGRTVRWGSGFGVHAREAGVHRRDLRSSRFQGRQRTSPTGAL